MENNMKLRLFGLILFFFNLSYAATSEMNYYDATAFILNHLELPQMGTVADFEKLKKFSNVSITTIIDNNGWGYINFQSNQGSFRIEKAADIGLFEDLINSSQIKNGHSDTILVSCKYTVGQPERNWLSPFIAKCNLTF